MKKNKKLLFLDMKEGKVITGFPDYLKKPWRYKFLVAKNGYYRWFTVKFRKHDNSWVVYRGSYDLYKSWDISYSTTALWVVAVPERYLPAILVAETLKLFGV